MGRLYLDYIFLQTREVGDGDRIGGIVGLRDGIHTENNFESVLYLFLFGSSIPTDSPLDLEGGKFPDRYSFLLECEEDGSSCLGNIDTGFLIGSKKESLDTANIRMIGVDEVSEITCDVRELEGNIYFRRSGNNPVIEDIHGSIVFFDQSKADGRGPRIDT